MRGAYCAGCYRTLEEIARWGEMQDAEREAVLARLAERRSKIAEVPVPPPA
jgi:predicted Fe-S protein YdhL (DUF1289 family)